MNFDLSEEQQLLADSLKRYLTNEYSIEARAKIVASSAGWSLSLYKGLPEKVKGCVPISPAAPALDAA